MGEIIEATIVSPVIGKIAAVAAVGVMTEKSLMRSPEGREIVDLFDAADKGIDEAFPQTLSRKASRKIVRGLKGDIKSGGTSIQDSAFRLRAYACLKLIELASHPERVEIQG